MNLVRLMNALLVNLCKVVKLVSNACAIAFATEANHAESNHDAAKTKIWFAASAGGGECPFGS